MSTTHLPYTTFDKVKAKLGLSDVVDAALDAYLTEIIAQVSYEFDTFVFGYEKFGFAGEIGSTSQNEWHDGGWDTIVLRRRLSVVVSSRQSVNIKENGGNNLIDGTDFMIPEYPSNTIFRLAGPDDFNAIWAPGSRTVQVTYDPDFSVLEIPPDVVRATEEESARAYLAGNTDSATGGFLAISQRTPDAGTAVTYQPDDWSPHTLRVMESHRRHQRFL